MKQGFVLNLALILMGGILPSTGSLPILHKGMEKFTIEW